MEWQSHLYNPKKADGEQNESGEIITTESFLALCYKCGLSRVDLDDLTIGMCLDFIYEYIDFQKPQKEKVRKASQRDFDSF